MTPLVFRSDYARTSAGSAELERLIRDIFAVDVSPLDRLGHDPSVMAFGWWLENELVANVSLYERQLWLSGKKVAAFGVQSVAVRPEWRGRGLFRDLMTRVLDFADSRSRLVILVTGTPELYAPFGFRKIGETIFSGKVSRGALRPGSRRLSLNDDSDLALLSDLFSRRTPTSYLASACDHPALFLLKAAGSPAIELRHLLDLDAVVAIQGLNSPCLTLLDVVAASMPSLQEIIAALGHAGEQVEVRLTPDRLSWQTEAQTAVDNGYMVRGEFSPEDQAFMFSDMRI